MTVEELQDLLTLAGYSSRVRGQEVIIQECWFCGNDRGNLELNPTKGIYSCWNCRESGRLDQLLTQTLRRPFSIPVDFEKTPGLASLEKPPEFDSVPAQSVGSALHYLTKRGIPSEVVQAYNLRVCVEKDHDLEGRILFPLREFWSMKFIGWVGRSYTGRFPKYRHSLSKKEICGYRTRDQTTPCFLVEGCLDGIAVHRAGFQAAVLLGTSSPDIEDFAGRLPKTTPLGILLDGSAEREAIRLSWKIQPIRPALFVSLPPNLDPAGLLPESLRVFLLERLEYYSKFVE